MTLLCLIETLTKSLLLLLSMFLDFRLFSRSGGFKFLYSVQFLSLRIVTECGENIDREQLDTTLDVVHFAGMD